MLQFDALDDHFFEDATRKDLRNLSVEGIVPLRIHWKNSS